MQVRAFERYIPLNQKIQQNTDEIKAKTQNDWS